MSENDARTAAHPQRADLPHPVFLRRPVQIRAETSPDSHCTRKPKRRSSEWKHCVHLCLVGVTLFGPKGGSLVLCRRPYSVATNTTLAYPTSSKRPRARGISSTDWQLFPQEYAHCLAWGTASSGEGLRHRSGTVIRARLTLDRLAPHPLPAIQAPHRFQLEIWISPQGRAVRRPKAMCGSSISVCTRSSRC